MLDRYEQHTLKCSSCKKAYTTFQTLQKFLIGVAVVGSAAAGVPPDMQLRVILAGLAIVSASLAYVLHDLQKNFVFIDYVHAEIDWICKEKMALRLPLIYYILRKRKVRNTALSVQELGVIVV